MSKVFSFRLSDDNPREVKVREVIEVWMGEGYSLRHVVTEALLGLHNGENNHPDLDQLIGQLKEVVWGLKDKQGVEEVAQHEESVLPVAFVSAIKRSARSGISTGR